MRARLDVARRRRRYPGGRLGIVVTIGVAFLLLASLRGIAVFYTDYLWFGSVGLTSVWAGVLGTEIGLALVFSGAFFVVLWISLAIADRVAPPLRAAGTEDELVQRYRSFVSRRPILIRTIASVVLALLAGTGASAEWNNWILFTNAVPFGKTDPLFHRDLGFFVFKLPFLSFVVGWAFVALVVLFIATTVAHYLNGGIRIQGPAQRVSPEVKAHLSAILALLALVKAAGYYLARFQLDLSTRGYREGASYTDIHAQLPALSLLIFISFVCLVIFVVNIKRRGWVLPVIGLGLWAFVAVVVGAIYPSIVQTFTVQPDQLHKEYPYIQRNVNATRQAMGITDVKVQPFGDTQGLTVKDLTQHLSTLQDVRLWDPQFAQTSYNKLQALRTYYQFNNFGLDRYNVGGQLTPAIMSVRQLDSGGLQAKSWVNEHLQYTHGYGAVLSPANTSTGDGNPVFAIQDVPPSSAPGAPVLQQPAVYYGTGLSGYVIADTRQAELNYQNTRTGVSEEGHYLGKGGVPAGGFVRRAAFSLRFGDINPLISSLVTSQSRVMFVRDVQARVQKVAPFLSYDANPYPVVVDGQIYYVIDAYTISDHYPYGEEADTGALPARSGLDTSFNYVRNSVKVVVNAYSGAMTFYVVDPSDPIVRAYEHAFPKLFTKATRMPIALKSHMRYPKDLFTVQAAMLGRYHISDPTGFYNAGDAWTLSQDPGTGPVDNMAANAPLTNANGQPIGPPAPTPRMGPIYQVTQLPGDPSLTFNLTEPYVPVSANDTQQNLTGFLVARCTPGSYGDGQLELYETPRGQQFNGPALVNSQIQQNSKITSAITLLDQHGSTVLLGTVLVVPIDQSLLYIRPLYVQSSQNPLPQLQRVIVVYGSKSAMEPTLAQAVAAVVGHPVPGLGTVPGGASSSGAGGGSGPAVSPAVDALIKQADAALAQAQADLHSGDLGGYQADVDHAQQLLSQAEKADHPAPGSKGA
ncbi:MAG: UPF0182 family protein [Acidimicrobiales bacterium]